MDDLELSGLKIETQPQEFKYRTKEDAEYMGRTAYTYDERKKYGPQAVEREQRYTEDKQNALLENAQNRMGEDAYLRGIHRELNEIRAQVNQEKTEFQKDYSNFLTEQLELDESKYRGKDGEEMQKIKQGLRTLTTSLQTPITHDMQKNLPMHVVNLEKQYDWVINACELYESTHNPWFPTGKRRLRMVMDMKEFCIKEKALLTPALNQFLETDTLEDITWGDILYNVRAITIDPANIQKAHGGAISDVHKISLDGGQTFKYLSYETTALKVDFYANAQAGIDEYKEQSKKDKNLIENYGDACKIMERLLKVASKHSKEEQNQLYEKLIDFMFSEKTWGLDDYLQLPEWAKKAIAIDTSKNAALVSLMGSFSAFADRYMKGARAVNSISRARIHLDAVISRRNVASSRVASLLGMDDIIKKSRTVLVKGEDGKLMRANLMDEASGISMRDVRNRAITEKKKIAYTPEATRQLAKLEIFDAICGQVDRHRGNYNVNVEEHDNKLVITGIQVFDNDMAFGDFCFNDIRRGVGEQAGLFYSKSSKSMNEAAHLENQQKAHMINPVNGESYLFHHMDKELYERIIILDDMKEFLVLQLVELGLSETEINALKDRISGIRQFLDQAVAELTKEGNMPYLLEKEQWNQMNTVSDIQPANSSSAKIGHDKWVEETLWKQS